MWASILIGLSACLGNVVDAMIVGNLIDEDSVSAFNLSLPFLQFMYTVNMLLATGSGMLVGMELGKKDTQRASYIFIISMLASLLRPLMAYNMSGSHKTRWIESTNDCTTQVLYRLGFQWPATAIDYVHRFVDTIVGFDYFSI